MYYLFILALAVVEAICGIILSFNVIFPTYWIMFMVIRLYLYKALSRKARRMMRTVCR